VTRPLDDATEGLEFDVDAIREYFPALSDGTAYFDGPGGSQTPTVVADAIRDAILRPLSNRGNTTTAARNAEEIVVQCRVALSDLLNADPDEVIFGRSMTALTFDLSRTLSAQWRPGDEIVVTRLDHDANVRPWVQAAARAGATLRWAEVDLPAGELPPEQYEALVGERTRLVAVSAASNVLGTRPDVAAISEIAHRAGALVYVDGVHATAHGPVDMTALGADLYATSAYKWCGPHVGAVAGDPERLADLLPDKLASSPDEVPDRFETGTAPFADLAGVTAAVEHLAALDDSATGSRRERLLASMAAAEAHELELFATLIDGLAAIPSVTTYGAPARRTATAYFTVDGHTPRAVAEHLAAHRVNVWNGHNYAWELTAALGIRDAGSAVRAGLVHYNDAQDVERVLSALARL